MTLAKGVKAVVCIKPVDDIHPMLLAKQTRTRRVVECYSSSV